MAALMDQTTLKAVARDVSYEVNRLFEAAALWPHVPEDKGRRLILEALLLHFRNVLDFFFGAAKNADDVHASHFFDDVSEWKPAKPAWLEEYRRRCNKLLAHLTYSRVEYDRRGEMSWKLDDKLVLVRETWYAFLNALPQERRQWFP